MLDLIRSFWNGLTPDMQTAVVGALATVISATFGVMVVVWQIGRQGKQALLQNRHTETLKLKLQIYEQIIQKCATTSDAHVTNYTYIQKFVADLTLYRGMQGAGQSYRVPEARWNTMNDLQSQLGEVTSELIIVTEQWGILHPGLEVMRMALNAAMHDIRDAYLRYMTRAARFMPLERPDQQQGSLFPWVCPTDEEFGAIKAASKELGDRIWELGSYIYDFQVEMQNLLLGELFEERLAPRSPLDPKVVVLRLSEYERQREFFEGETTWGKQKQEFDRELRAEFDTKLVKRPLWRRWLGLSVPATATPQGPAPRQQTPPPKAPEQSGY